MIIFPSERLPDIEQAVQATSIYPEWIRYIYTGQKKTPKRVIFSGCKDITTQKRILRPNLPVVQQYYGYEYITQAH